jgi:hypothetical protein
VPRCCGVCVAMRWCDVRALVWEGYVARRRISKSLLPLCHCVCERRRRKRRRNDILSVNRRGSEQGFVLLCQRHGRVVSFAAHMKVILLVLPKHYFHLAQYIHKYNLSERPLQLPKHLSHGLARSQPVIPPAVAKHFAVPSTCASSPRSPAKRGR